MCHGQISRDLTTFPDGIPNSAFLQFPALPAGGSLSHSNPTLGLHKPEPLQTEPSGLSFRWQLELELRYRPLALMGMWSS